MLRIFRAAGVGSTMPVHLIGGGIDLHAERHFFSQAGKLSTHPRKRADPVVYLHDFGVTIIVYMSGIGIVGTARSKHLRSRKLVGHCYKILKRTTWLNVTFSTYRVVDLCRSGEVVDRILHRIKAFFTLLFEFHLAGLKLIAKAFININRIRLRSWPEYALGVIKLPNGAFIATRTRYLPRQSGLFRVVGELREST